MRWRRLRSQHCGLTLESLAARQIVKVLALEVQVRTWAYYCASSGRRWRQLPLPRLMPRQPAPSVRGSSETLMPYVVDRDRRIASRVEVVRLPPLLCVLGFQFWVVALLEEVRV